MVNVSTAIQSSVTFFWLIRMVNMVGNKSGVKVSTQKGNRGLECRSGDRG